MPWFAMTPPGAADVSLGEEAPCVGQAAPSLAAYLDTGSAEQDVLRGSNRFVMDAAADKEAALAANASWVDPQLCYVLQLVDWAGQYRDGIYDPPTAFCTRVYRVGLL